MKKSASRPSEGFPAVNEIAELGGAMVTLPGIGSGQVVLRAAAEIAEARRYAVVGTSGTRCGLVVCLFFDQKLDPQFSILPRGTAREARDGTRRIDKPNVEATR